MTPATPIEISNLLGEIDPLVIEQILELGATVDDVVQALACIETDRAGEARAPMSTQVAAIYAILDDALDDLEQEDRAYPAAG